MAKRRETQDDLQKTKRISPYHEMDEAYESETEYDAPDEYEDAYDDAYDESYAYDDADQGEYDDEDQDEGQGGFFSTLVGKIFVGVIVLLLIVLIALLAVRFLNKPDDQQTLPSATTAPTSVPAQQTTASAPIIFAPVVQESEEPTPEPTAVPTPTPTAEPTATPLPIILTNTPTPTPTATPTPTPTATPEPTPTPTPAPTAVPEAGRGEVNRDANLRESAASNGKVKQTVKKGEAVTIHSTLKDKSGKVWYQLTVDDQAVTGFMRDYVIDLAGKLIEIEEEQIEETTEPEQIEAETKDSAQEEEDAELKDTEPEDTELEDAIATGETNRDANLRKSMNGSVLGTIKEGKRVSIHEVLQDKSKNTWYRLSVDGSDQAGYMRDFVIELDGDVELKYQTEVEKASVGTARTNRLSNVRKAPQSDAAIVRQISKNVKVHILGKYKDNHNQIWYQISTETGNTTGFMRDYVLDNVKLDDDVETQTYSE